MRALWFVLTLVLGALFLALPERATATALASADVVDNVASSAVAEEAVPESNHCAHVPCTNAAHSHASGSCAAHSFIVLGAGWGIPRLASGAVIGFKHDRYVGRTLLPPVPPPLV